jgi:diguanylate cyclase (GGDEF)-like protein
MPGRQRIGTLSIVSSEKHTEGFDTIIRYTFQRVYCRGSLLCCERSRFDSNLLRGLPFPEGRLRSQPGSIPGMVEDRSRVCMRNLYILVALAGLLCAAHGEGISAARLRVLSTCRAAHDLSLAQASRGYPVHLRAVVTYYDADVDPRHAALFVHDATGSIFMALPSQPVLLLKPGTLVDVEGETGTGDYAPLVLNPRIKIIGSGALPQTAPRPTMTELLSGSQDGQWVEIEGIVQAIRKQFREVTLEIGTVGGVVLATTPLEPGADCERLIDSAVRIRGNAVPVFNNSREMVGARLLFPSMRQLTIEQPAASDPMSAPVVPVPQLLQFAPGVVLRHRNHIRGAVTLVWPSRLVCLQEGSRGLCMMSDSGEAMQVGEMVDAVGFPVIKDLKPTLQNASFRVAHETAFIAAIPITVRQALEGGHDQELIQIDGELIGQDRSAGDLTLGLRSGNFLYSAILPNANYGPISPRWKEGSTLRLTGICEVLMDPRTSGDASGAVRPGSMRILLRTAGDVVVLNAPSWWTRGRVAGLLAVVALAALVALGWGVTLRRKVEEQTKAIRQSQVQLRHISEHDILTGLPNRFLLNDRLEMALKLAARTQRIVGILMVDLDRFKDVNDTLGHRVGDLVLRETAVRLSRSVRAADTVARLGGDEFVVVLPDLRDESEAEVIASKIVEAMRQPLFVENERIAVSASVGVGSSAQEGRDAERLLHLVDAAMYRAKRSGRNAYRLSRCTEEPPTPASPESVLRN